MKLLVIKRAAHPRCFKNIRSRPCTYQFIDIDKEHDICHELTDSVVVENINSKSIKQMENNKFERNGENDLVNYNSTSTKFWLHEAIDQTRRIRDLVCKSGDTSERIFR
ncbi:hypothetical protein HZS_3236 [Henneguya salminicola]|nr:hypothetical protein HZS_3236 [Henneguya salminicola]